MAEERPKRRGAASKKKKEVGPFYLNINVEYHDCHGMESAKETLHNKGFMVIGRYDPGSESISFRGSAAVFSLVVPFYIEPEHSMRISISMIMHMANSKLISMPLGVAFLSCEDLDSVRGGKGEFTLKTLLFLRYSEEGPRSVDLSISWKKNSQWTIDGASFVISKDLWNEQMQHLLNMWKFQHSEDKTKYVIIR